MNTALYIHWPFCASKCPYCDFNSHVHETIDHGAWRDAYIKSIAYYAQLLPDRIVSSVFFGGGTPSLMRPDVVAEVLEEVKKSWRVVNDLEITLEANPTSVEIEKFREFRAAGVNRVSLGVQALHDDDLKFLGREHSVSEALQAIDIAGEVFDRFSFDLIYARPDQSLADWEAELRRAAGLARGHMSLYQLTIERNTPFYFAHEQGRFSIPKEELAADFYLLTQEVLEGAGLPAYEVSNHARAGQESAHNLTYWRYGDYIGLGPGAHGRLTLDGVKHACREHAAPTKWLEGEGIRSFTALSARERFIEALVMGLRITEGLPLSRLEEEGACAWRDMIDVKKLESLANQGWLCFDDRRITLGVEGLLRLNAVAEFIVKDNVILKGLP